MVGVDHIVQRTCAALTYDVHYDDLVSLFVSTDWLVHGHFPGFLFFLTQSHEKFIFNTFGCVA